MEYPVAESLLKTNLEQKLIDEILSLGRLKRAHQGQTIISPGSESSEMPLVMEGLLKVMRQDENGNEIFLYYLGGGETCAMSITCCLEGKKNEFKVTVEEDSVLWMIPMGHLDSWLQKYQSFRRFIFNSYQARFDEMLETIDGITFMKMDERLYKFLLDTKQASGTYVINKTHEQIARELNTSRVVVSRLLKQLERQDKIELHRNKIEVL